MRSRLSVLITTPLRQVKQRDFSPCWTVPPLTFSCISPLHPYCPTIRHHDLVRLATKLPSTKSTPARLLLIPGHPEVFRHDCFPQLHWTLSKHGAPTGSRTRAS